MFEKLKFWKKKKKEELVVPPPVITPKEEPPVSQVALAKIEKDAAALNVRKKVSEKPKFKGKPKKPKKIKKK